MAKARTRAAAPPDPAVGGAAPGDGYHHGDLRAALIAAAEEELAEKGVEGFTLRGCARRAGVSHAAPAHHFKDVRALLTVLGARGFHRLAEMTEAFGNAAPPGTREHFTAIGRGYVTFALENPASFDLIFRMDRLDRDDPDYCAAGAAAFGVPIRAVGAYFGSEDPMAEPQLAARVVGLWSIAHGFATLLLSGHLAMGAPDGDPAALVDRLLPEIIRQFIADDEPATARTTKSRRTRPAAE